MREPVPEDVAATLLYEADRTCCVCNIPGRPVQIHHVDEDSSNNDPDNLVVLCLDCHNETHRTGGFGRRLAGPPIRKYRDSWHKRVEARRAEADRLAATVVTPLAEPEPPPFRRPDVPSQTGLIKYVNTLPRLRALAYDAAQPGWAGSTAEMAEASGSIVDVLIGVLSRLARYYPYGHFDTEHPREYFAEVVASRYRWHHYRHSTAGMGFSGTIVITLTGADVVADVERMVTEVVEALLGWEQEGFSCEQWLKQWHAVDATPRRMH